MTINFKPIFRTKQNTNFLHEALNIDSNRWEFFSDEIAKFLINSTTIDEDIEQLWEISETIEEFAFVVFNYGRALQMLKQTLINN